MGYDETVRVMTEAIENLDNRFRGFWNDNKYAEAHEAWTDAQVLRRERDEFRDSQRQSVRLP